MLYVYGFTNKFIKMLFKNVNSPTVCATYQKIKGHKNLFL